MKPITRIVSVLLFLIAVMHLLRMIFDVRIVAGGYVVPMWLSLIACLVAGTLAVLLFKEGRKRS
jgi:membrane protein implicated in regulation of membrane protease activity